ncbi:MAG: phenylacetate--CoA ligase family protein, partial [Candidatus Freyarchaeota archaeon]
MTNYLRAMYYLLSMLRRARWSRERLRKYRNFRVREIVRYAYEHVPYYHEKFNELKVKPSDVRTVEDLKKLPIIRKDEVRRNLDKLISREYDVAKLKMLKTSGSTGEPLFFYLSGAEDEFRKAKHVRANMAVGQRLRDRWVTITAPVHFNEAGRLQRILGVYVPISVSVFDDVSTQLSKIEGLKPDVIDGYASSLMLLARELERRGLDTVKPRLMISGAEALNLFSPRFIEDVFNAPIYDQYAAAEFERLAWQCEERSGYHIDADTVVMEFVDENGEWVSPGETGEIVCTSLFNHAMPLIRYALEDLGTPSEERDCPCGRTFPLMKVVEGRVNDVVVLPDGRV